MTKMANIPSPPYRRYLQKISGKVKWRDNYSTSSSPVNMTLWKYQKACIFNLVEKANGVYKYAKVRSCLETTMKKFSLSYQEILGFTMCVRDKPIGQSLINIIYEFKILISSNVDQPLLFLRAYDETKKVPSYITEKLTLINPQFPADNKFLKFQIPTLNFHGCEIVYFGQISCHLENCKENAAVSADMCIRVVFKIFGPKILVLGRIMILVNPYK